MASTSSVKAKIQGLIDTANATTGNADTNLTSAVDALIEKGKKGASLNIAYGDTAPDDTSKLWVKTSEPSGVVVDKNIDYGGNLNETITVLDDVFIENTSGMVGAAYGNKIYLLGGSVNQTAIRRFNTVDNTTVTLDGKKLPVNVMGTSNAVVGSKIYLFGGPSSTFTDLFTVFDMSNESITVMPLMPSQRSGAGCAAIDNMIYLFGGYDGSGGYKNEIRCYDTADGVFTTVQATTMPQAVYCNSCIAVGKKIYSFGGYGSNRQVKLIFVFNSENPSVVELKSLPTTLSAPAVAYHDNKIYIIGGGTSNTTYSDKVYEFDVLSETIAEQPLGCVLPNAVSRPCAVTIGSKTYLFCGYSNNGDTKTISIFEPANVTYFVEADKLHLVTDTSNSFNIINNENTRVQVGVIKAYKGNADGIGEEVEMALHKNGAWETI